MVGVQEALSVLGLLIKHEELIAELYDQFARRYAGHRALWSGLADEEREHANWIRRLYLLAQRGEVRIVEERFNVQALRTSLHYMKVLLEHARQGISAERALAVGVQIESSMAEDRRFEVFASNDAEGQRLLEQLRRDIQGHRARIEQARDAIGPVA